MNDNPTGNPYASPIGTVTIGYPATADAVELPPASRSPFTTSIRAAGRFVGATSASSRCSRIRKSIPSSRPQRWTVDTIWMYSGSSSVLFVSASSKRSCPNHGISSAA